MSGSWSTSLTIVDHGTSDRDRSSPDLLEMLITSVYVTWLKTSWFGQNLKKKKKAMASMKSGDC